MMEYLDRCETNQTACSLLYPALHYILRKNITNPDLQTVRSADTFIDGNDEKLVQMLFDKSPVKMRMYGSAKELAENVRIFMNFPGSHRCFIEIEHEPYTQTPIVYESLRSEKFICKLDLFSILQSMVLRSSPGSEPFFLVSMISYFLKFEEKRLDGLAEFVRFDETVYEEMWNEIRAVHEKVQSFISSDVAFDKLLDNLKTLSIPQLFEKLKTFIPNNWSEDEGVRVNILLTHIVRNLNEQDSTFAYFASTAEYVHVKILVEILQKLIQKRPEMFLPHSAIRINPEPVTVRVFEDRGMQFVMKLEFFNALKEYSMGTIRIDHVYEEYMFDCMLLKDVLNKYGGKIKNMEFIRYPIKRAKHRAVPVNGPDSANRDKFFILAVDALFEVLRSLMFEDHLFQRQNPGIEQRIAKLSLGLNIFFSWDYDDFYFIQTSVLDDLRTLLIDSNNAKKPVKNVRNAKSDGFTLQNLKNELEHLGLTVAFPEIQNYAEVVYEHVNRVKKERFLRTCDLFDAIEQCQLICIFDRLPDLKKFLHNQGGCGRVVGVKCQLCGSKKPLELQYPVVRSIEIPTEMEEKLLKLEIELLQKSKEIERLDGEIIKLTTENETKSGIIEKLMDKLSITATQKSLDIDLN